MKKIFLLGTLFLVLLSFSITKAQWSVNVGRLDTKYGLELDFAGTMDSTGQTYGTLTSNIFDLSGFDGVTDINYGYLVTNTSGAPKVKVTLLHSDFTSTAASMVATVLQDSIKTETEVNTFQALQGIRAKYYRLKLESLAGGRDASVFKIKFILPKRDY